MDKSSLVKHLHISPVEDGEKMDQERGQLDEGRASPSRSSESVDDGLFGKKKGTLSMRKWGKGRWCIGYCITIVFQGNKLLLFSCIFTNRICP